MQFEQQDLPSEAFLLWHEHPNEALQLLHFGVCLVISVGFN